MDLNGIYRAPKEYILQVIEIFIDCIIFGFAINSMMKQDEITFHKKVPTVHYWIVIDCVLMFFTIFYVYLVQKMMQQGEIIKNIYSLHFIQKQKEKKKRQGVDTMAELVKMAQLKQAEDEKKKILEEEFKNYHNDSGDSDVDGDNVISKIQPDNKA